MIEYRIKELPKHNEYGELRLYRYLIEFKIGSFWIQYCTVTTSNEANFLIYLFLENQQLCIEHFTNLYNKMFSEKIMKPYN